MHIFEFLYCVLYESGVILLSMYVYSVLHCVYMIYLLLIMLIGPLTAFDTSHFRSWLKMIIKSPSNPNPTTAHTRHPLKYSQIYHNFLFCYHTQECNIIFLFCLSQWFNPRMGQVFNQRMGQVINPRMGQVFNPRMGQVFNPRQKMAPKSHRILVLLISHPHTRQQLI